MVNLLLFKHPLTYSLSLGDTALALGTGFSGIPYAIRHWQQANQPGTNYRYSLANRFITVVQLLPLVGGIAAILERIIAVVYKWLRPVQQKNVTNIPLNDHPPSYDLNPVNWVFAKEKYQISANENAENFRKAIFQDTLKASKQGYVRTDGKPVLLIGQNNQPDLGEVTTYSELPALPPAHQVFNTQFSVNQNDTLQALLRLKNEGGNPLGINMANRFYPGGGVELGYLAQEESICQRTNHFLQLKTQSYPFPEFGGIYCNKVKVFRKSDREDYAFMNEPVNVALVANAAYCLPDAFEAATLNIPQGTVVDENNVHLYPLFTEGTRKKIRNMLRMAAIKGHKELVLGALGCGAFRNPPRHIAQIFHDIFNEPEFRGRFSKVVFAILKVVQRDQDNIDKFRAVFG